MAMGTGMGTGMGTDTANRPRLKKFGLLGMGLSLLVIFPAWAGEWTITPTITAVETRTDNVGQVEKNKQSDWVTDITPGINIKGVGDRVKLDFDYQMHNLLYARDSSRNNIQNSLSAFGSLEAIENLFFIDASASVFQQNISAFRGATYSSSVDVSDNDNTTETRTYELSPYFKGTLGSFAEYQLRYSMSESTSDEKGLDDVKTKELAAYLAGVKGAGRMGWALEANTRQVDYARGKRDNEADLLRGTLTYHYSPQFRVSLIGGWESNDYVSVNKESHTIVGAGFEWAPTERTLLAVSHEDRFFGDSNSISFSHRTPRTAWNYRETKDAQVATDQTSSILGTNYDLFYNMFSSAIPDPAARAAFVNALLLRSGVDPHAQLQGGYATTGVTLQHQRELSFALRGVRNTVTFAATWNKTKELSQGVGSGLYLGSSFGNASDVRQQGVSVNWSHQLTGFSTLTGSVSRLESKGSGGTTSQDTEQTMMTINFLTQLGPKTNAGLGIRRTKFDGTAGASNYTENALSGSISHRF